MEIKIDWENLKHRKLFIGTPMYGGLCNGQFAKSIADLSGLCVQYGIELKLYFLFNESLITRARNYVADEFMRSDACHLMFIDADIGFNPNDVLILMALQANDPETYNIVGAPYPKKNISWEKVVLAVNKGVADKDPNVLANYVGDFVFNPKANQNQFSVSEPVEVLELGTGFMMIAKEALNTFGEEFPELMYKPDHGRSEHFNGSREIMQYFQAERDLLDPIKFYEQEIDRISELKMPHKELKKQLRDIKTNLTKANKETKSNRYLSEDYWFCQKSQEIGLKIWLCPWMELQHTGSYIFGGSLAALSSIGASATI